MIEYYDADDLGVSTSPDAPDAIYPDPESIYNQKLNGEHRPYDNSDFHNVIHRNGLSKTSATKFNQLQELNSPPMSENDAINGAIRSIDFNTESDMHSGTSDDGTFKGKSIDFNIRHTMEELKNEDLRDHDIIDNIMYIYYGSNVALRKSLGGSIIIVGTVFALAAQILAIVFTLLRNR